MDTNTATRDAPPGPLLRTLAPALRQLERSLRQWFDAPHRYPLSTITRATLEGLSIDLRRQSEALDMDRPLLVIMLMGGTGVGKSTLLNALAGGSIAQASFARPTTRDPVVYYHESVRTDRLDPALQHCRLAPHDRPALEQKILVDTPDIDSNDLANREKLLRLLPVADVVLYVGSQEKYHDKLGWDLFLHQRRRRAFAFVLNKWDRCVSTGASGMRPDEDLLHDLESEGFKDPLLFRTCAQLWVDHANGDGAADGKPAAVPASLPEGEQFAELARWLEMGLTRLEIEAIKARGVSQLLHHLQDALAAACPPDLAEVAARTQSAWERILGEEAGANAEVLLNTLEPYQREIEHHFALEGQRRFRGLMGGYLHLFTRMKYAGSSLRDRIPFVPRVRSAVVTPAAWDLSTFTRACSDVAATRTLDARGKALANRLLVTADEQGFPLDLLNEPVESTVKMDWRQRYAQTLVEVLHQVEQQWARPTGARRWLQTIIVFLADWVPSLALLASLIMLLWRYFDPMSRGYEVHLIDALLPLIVLLITLVMLHILIALLLPLRWRAIRGEFQGQLEQRLHTELVGAYTPVPADVAEALRLERKQVEQLLKETAEVTTWLEQREQAASIAGLYGREEQRMADGKWIDGLHADTPLADAARRVLAVRLEVVRDKLPLAVHKPDEDIEHVHHLRVGTRRAGAALEIFAPCLPDKVHKKAGKQLRRIRRAAGEARDWDVFLTSLQEREQGRPERERVGLDFLFGYAQGQRIAAQLHLEAAVPAEPLHFDQLLSETVAAVREPRSGPQKLTLVDWAQPLLLDLLRELDEAASQNLDDYEHLHQVRIIGKRLRYAMEVFADCFIAPFREEIYPAVEQMQDILGRANDSHVAVQRLTILREKLKKAWRAEWKRVQPGIESLLRFHQRRLPQERKQFVKWWDRWQVSGAETALTTLLRAPQSMVS